MARLAYHQPKPMSSAPICPGWRRASCHLCYHSIDELLAHMTWCSSKLSSTTYRQQFLGFRPISIDPVFASQQANVHVVLAFSPVGDAFRTRDSLGNLETDGQLHQCADDQHYTKAYLKRFNVGVYCLCSLPFVFSRAVAEVCECSHPWWIAAPLTGSQNGLLRCGWRRF